MCCAAPVSWICSYGPCRLEVPIGGGRLMQTDPVEVTTGGIVSNAGIALARLGMKVAAFSYVGPG